MCVAATNIGEASTMPRLRPIPAKKKGNLSSDPVAQIRVLSPVLNDPRGRLYWLCRPAVESDVLRDAPFIESNGRILVVVGEGRLLR
jgi:hypothetical protein